MLLSVKERQKYLKELGFYTGEIDGSAGVLTKKAYRDLQNKYFTRAKDKDGIYGINTDTLLRSAYNVRDLKYFRLQEFKCKCNGKYCTGYPAVVDYDLAHQLDFTRLHFGEPCDITSGLRCKNYNKVVGGDSNSYHITGKAVDVYIHTQSSTHAGRVTLVDYWDLLDKSTYAYCNRYFKRKGKNAVDYISKTMGNATHLNV